MGLTDRPTNQYTDQYTEQFTDILTLTQCNLPLLAVLGCVVFIENLLATISSDQLMPLSSPHVQQHLSINLPSKLIADIITLKLPLENEALMSPRSPDVTVLVLLEGEM